ncbi:MAG TPA: trypsin-like peptidase domain-containing protein [Patescibacteria group bacterium]|nr:trypsin-like peptidase domain-containing protein [Patescibacteria group bacterium]
MAVDEKNELEQIFQNKKERKGNYVGLIIIFTIIAILAGIVSSYGFVTYYMSKNVGTPGAAPKVTEKYTVEESSGVVDSVKKVSPSVVSITTTSKAISFWGQTVEQKGGGTGFIITNDGLILTNKHVVNGATDVTVITNDGKDYQGKVVALDPLFDFALVKIEAKGLPIVELGDSSMLEAGQRVIAIGNALGEYDNSVTVGVISGIARAITASDGSGSSSRLEGLIQTDAPINPGNSGGPLVNIQGQVVGINTAIDSTANSIGFALPINSAKIAIDSYIKKGKIVRPFIGVRYINITREFAAANDISVTAGALILAGQTTGETVAIVPGGPADKAGMQVNDIIISVNDEKITENKGLISALSSYEPGTVVEVKYLRKGEEKTTKVTLGEMK